MAMRRAVEVKVLPESWRDYFSERLENSGGHLIEDMLQ